jgi:hypothetical protein
MDYLLPLKNHAQSTASVLLTNHKIIFNPILLNMIKNFTSQCRAYAECLWAETQRRIQVKPNPLTFSLMHIMNKPSNQQS